jgi:hypothetical protein
MAARSKPASELYILTAGPCVRLRRLRAAVEGGRPGLRHDRRGRGARERRRPATCCRCLVNGDVGRSWLPASPWSEIGRSNLSRATCRLSTVKPAGCREYRQEWSGEGVRIVRSRGHPRLAWARRRGSSRLEDRLARGGVLRHGDRAADLCYGQGGHGRATPSRVRPAVRSEGIPDHVRVTADKKLVKDAPSIDTDGELTAAEEPGVFEHYGLRYEPGTSGERRLGRR